MSQSIDSIDDERELLGRLVAEYSGQINKLRAALNWIGENSSDPKIVGRVYRELERSPCTVQ